MPSSRSPRTSSTSSAPPRTNRRVFWTGMILAITSLLVCSCVVAGTFSYVLFREFFQPGQAAPDDGRSTHSPLGAVRGHSPSAVALDFMQALEKRLPSQAYRDLGNVVQVVMSIDDFTRQIAQAEVCAGQVTTFRLVQSQIGQESARITYQVARERLPAGYSFELSLAPDEQGKWSVTDYGPGGRLVPPETKLCH